MASFDILSLGDTSTMDVNELEKLRTDESIRTITANMYLEECEHLYSSFPVAYLKYRNVVAEWMIDVTGVFKLHPTTTHAAISYLDRLQPDSRFSRFEWQVLAICCILIASKYNECEEHVPILADLEEITQEKISNTTVLNYELWALKRMGWKLNARTAMAFLSAYFAYHSGIILPSDSSSTTDIHDQAVKRQVEQDMEALATKSILDDSLKSTQGSIIASAIVCHVRAKYDITPLWPAELTSMTYHEAPTSAAVAAVLNKLVPNSTEDPETETETEESESQSSYEFSSPVKSAPAGDITHTTPCYVDENNVKVNANKGKFDVSPVSIANGDFI